MLNPRLDDLPGYPFARLRALLGGVAPAANVAPMNMSIGEPQHAPPAFVAEILAKSAEGWGKYPLLRGTPEFRRAVADWLTRRFALPQGFIVAEDNILPVAGTREAIYMFASIAVARRDDGPAAKAASANKRPLVLVPNPLYHVYAGAAQMAGADPVFVPAAREACWPAKPISPLCSRRSWPMTPFSPSTNAIRKSTTRTNPSASSRPAPRSGRTRRARSTMSSSSIRCPSARAAPACAPASSPAANG
jgi:hypothetical protein